MKKGMNKHSILKWKHRLLIMIITLFIGITNVKAWVKIDNNEFTNNYPLLYFNNGSHLFEYGGLELPALDPYKSTYNSYHVFMFCYNGENITEFDQYNSGGSPNGTTSTKWSVINSNNVCIYTPGGATGKIVYILAHNQYNSQLTSESSVMQGKFNFKIPGSGSTVWYFISDFHDLKPITFDYTTNTIIAQNEDIKSKLDSLLNWQNAIYTAIVNSDTKLNNINQNLTEQKEQFKEQIQNQEEANQKMDEFLNSDLSEEDKQKPNQDGFDSYQESENELKDKMNQADLGNVSIGIDANSSSWIWNTLESLIRSHTAVFGMFIAILSIGIIKLALGR